MEIANKMLEILHCKSKGFVASYATGFRNSQLSMRLKWTAWEFIAGWEGLDQLKLTTPTVLQLKGGKALGVSEAFFVAASCV